MDFVASIHKNPKDKEESYGDEQFVKLLIISSSLYFFLVHFCIWTLDGTTRWLVLQ